jgi:hypothetical protein
MEVSFAGVLISLSALAAGYLLGSPIIVGLMISLAFGATAVGTLTSLGGASPLAYSALALLLTSSVALRRTLWVDVGSVFARYFEAWVVVALTLYAAAGAIILPRLFAGRTSAFVSSRVHGVLEMPLGPAASNITQSLYLAVGGLTFLAFCVLLRERRTWSAVKFGFFAWCTVHAALGAVDFTAKHLGAVDLLDPLRTATYVMHTGAREAGFFRITGGFSEASAFASTTLATLAFTVTYWRSTGHKGSLALSASLLFLLLLSTSTTAYFGLMVISIPLLASLAWRFLMRLSLSWQDVYLVAFFVLGSTAALAVMVYDPRAYDPLLRLFDEVMLNKADSPSGQERAYWNERSLQSFRDTLGLGMGIGSSRASSWLVAVVSQLGVLGTVMMGFLVISVSRPLHARSASRTDVEINALARSARACALAWLVAASLIVGTADPGIAFFVALSVVVAARGGLGKGGSAARDGIGGIGLLRTA